MTSLLKKTVIAAGACAGLFTAACSKHEEKKEETPAVAADPIPESMKGLSPLELARADLNVFARSDYAFYRVTKDRANLYAARNDGDAEFTVKENSCVISYKVALQNRAQVWTLNNREGFIDRAALQPLAPKDIPDCQTTLLPTHEAEDAFNAIANATPPAPPAPATPGNKSYSFIHPAKIHTAPNQNSAVVQTLAPGQCVTLLDAGADRIYARVSYKKDDNSEAEGWVTKGLLRPAPACTTAPQAPAKDPDDISGQYYRLRMKTYFTRLPGAPTYAARDEFSVGAGGCVRVELGKKDSKYVIATFTRPGEDRPAVRGWVMMNMLEGPGCK